MSALPLGFHVDDLGGQRVRFVIPAKRTWEGVAVLSVALIAWLGCELVVAGVLLSLASGQSPNPGGIGGILFLAAWLMFWTYGGLMVAYQWLWLFAGSEVVEINRDALHLERIVPGFARTRDYPLETIHDLRYDEDGQLRFTSEEEPVEFGEALEPLSARVMLEEIAVRTPQILDDGFFEGYLSEASSS